MRTSPVRPLVAFALAAAAIACNAPLVVTPVVVGHGAKVGSYPLTLKTQVDILFMVDNSGSMEAMQAELRARFNQFFIPFQKLAETGSPVDLHIGVVTSDYGAGRNSGSCDTSPGGDRGRLQAIGRAASPSCKRPVDGNFIRYRFDKGGAAAASNLPDGQDLLSTFTCMASVGARGCGFEHQLESVYSALHDGIPENAGFLRQDALLVVVFLTNEDDASAPPDTDVFDKNLVGQYGYLDSYSRQTRFGVMCCPPGRATCSDGELQFPPYASSNGPLAGCRPAPNFPVGFGPGKQYDASRYIDFFTRPASEGGVKIDPRDVVLVGIDAPEAPFEVILSNPGTAAGVPYAPCAVVDERTGACVPVLQHACQNPAQPGFFGDPAVRLNSVIRAAKHYAISSICDNDYSTALDNAASLVIASLSGSCLEVAPPKDQDGVLRPECDVAIVVDNLDGSQFRTPVAQCPEGGANPDPSTPCWRIEARPECKATGLGLHVDQAQVPAHAHVQFACALSDAP